MMKYEDYKLCESERCTITVSKKVSTSDGNDCKFVEGFTIFNKIGELETIEKYLSELDWDGLLEEYTFVSPESLESEKLMENMTAYKSEFYTTRDNTLLDADEYNNEKYYRRYMANDICAVYHEKDYMDHEIIAMYLYTKHKKLKYRREFLENKETSIDYVYDEQDRVISIHQTEMNYNGETIDITKVIYYDDRDRTSKAKIILNGVLIYTEETKYDDYWKEEFEIIRNIDGLIIEIDKYIYGIDGDYLISASVYDKSSNSYNRRIY